MSGPLTVWDAPFLHEEARELATLAEESVDMQARRRRPGSVLHTLGVELAVLAGLGDSRRMDWLVDEAARLLAADGKHEALAALRSALRGLSGRRMPSLAPR